MITIFATADFASLAEVGFPRGPHPEVYRVTTGRIMTVPRSFSCQGSFGPTSHRAESTSGPKA